MLVIMQEPFYLIFLKAFDCIDQELRLPKLNAYGLGL